MPVWVAKVLDLLVAYAPWIMSVLGPIFLMKYRKAKKAGEAAIEKMNTPQYVKDLLNSLDDVLEPVVQVIYDDYVKGMKAKSVDGKLTADEVKEVNAAALAKFSELAPNQLMEVLKVTFPPEKLAGVVLDVIKAKVVKEQKTGDSKLTTSGAVKNEKSRKFFAPPSEEDMQF